MKKGKLYLLPNNLGEYNNNLVIPSEVIAKTLQIRFFAVENVKNARRFLKSLATTFPIDDSHFIDLNKRTSHFDLIEIIEVLKNGNDVGILSEAGCPGIADPGTILVSLAHKEKIRVIPFVGPSSILLSIMSSGLSGQNFVFHGYLSKDRILRVKEIRKIENDALKTGYTHVFIETPYRNNNIFQDLIHNLKNETNLSVASNITLKDEKIKTMSVMEWKKEKINIGKNPTVYLIGK